MNTNDDKTIELLTELLHESRQTNKWLESLELQGERTISALNKLIQLTRDHKDHEKPDAKR